MLFTKFVFLMSFFIEVSVSYGVVVLNSSVAIVLSRIFFSESGSSGPVQ